MNLTRFEICTNKIIGMGSFGKVCLALDKPEKKLVAVKIEDKRSRKTLLKKEADILTSLGQHDNIIRLVAYLEDRNNNYMFTELYGPNIDTLHRKYNRSFPMDTVLRLAGQMLAAVEHCHRRGIVHGDIKPANFMVVFNPPHTRICLGDYGLSSRYMVDGQQIPYRTDVPRVGNMRFMSKNIHRSIQGAPRDDMYSLVYTFVYYPTGWLPWSGDSIQGMSGSQRHNKLYVIKSKASSREIVKKLKDVKYASAMAEYLEYLDTLEYNSVVDYNKLRVKIHTDTDPQQPWVFEDGNGRVSSSSSTSSGLDDS